MERGGRRKPGLYADILVPVLQVLTREEGAPGGLPNLLKEDEKKEDEEEKKDDGQILLIPFSRLSPSPTASASAEEVKHLQRPNIKNYVVPPEAPDHL